MKVIIADSGATKTDWALVQDEKPVYVRTSGLHPFYLEETAFQGNLLHELRASIGSFKPDVVRFYGAGCVSEQVSKPVRELLKMIFGDVTVEISDDLSAVARAFLPVRTTGSAAETEGTNLKGTGTDRPKAGNERKPDSEIDGDTIRGDGVAAIVGTGSSSGYFRDGKLVEKVPSLGFILGDEGGSADIARHLLSSMLRGAFSGETTDILKSAVGTSDYGQITTQLYGSDRPSYWLGQVTHRILKGTVTDEIREVVKARFQAFVTVHLKSYSGFPDYDLVVTGGIANALREDLTDVLEKNSICSVKIYENVITALARQQVNQLKASDREPVSEPLAPGLLTGQPDEDQQQSDKLRAGSKFT